MKVFARALFQITPIAMATAVVMTSMFAFGSAPIRIRVPLDAATLDWNRASDATSALLASQLMRGLYRVTSSGEVKPDLVSTFELKPLTPAKGHAKFEARLVLKSGVRWSDGKLLTSQNVADSIVRLLAKETASPVANYLFDLVGAEEYRAARAQTVAGLQVVSELELKLQFKKDVPYLKALFTHPCLYPIRKDLIDANPKLYEAGESLVVLGPYKIASRTPGVVTRLVPVDPKSKSHAVDWRVLESDSTAVDLFSTNHLDLVLGANVGLRREDSLTTPIDRVVGLLIPEVLRDRTSRIEQALDRKTLVKALGRGQAPTRKWLNGRFASGASKTAEALPVEAPAATTEMNAKVVSQRAKLIFIDRDETKKIAEVLQLQLRAAGLSLELMNLDVASFMARLHAPARALKQTSGKNAGAAPDVFLFSWNAGFPSAVSLLEISKTDGFLKSIYADPKFDSLLASGNYQEAEATLIERDRALIPLYTDTSTALVRQGLKGYRVESGRVPFADLRL